MSFDSIAINFSRKQLKKSELIAQWHEILEKVNNGQEVLIEWKRIGSQQS